jgi:neurotransmitter:Na+ symporter, NSS family
MANDARVPTPPDRGHWGSRLGFILAAAGSAVGLGNIWKFPTATADNGGGLFVLLYLGCIAVVGLPVMIAEVMVGRSTQRAPVGAYTALSRGNPLWALVGWMGVVTGLIILSYYSVVAGWVAEFVRLSIVEGFADKSPEAIKAMFSELVGSGGRSALWHGIFMVMTIGIVIGGVRGGLERGARVLMPLLFLFMIVMVIDGVFQPGFGEAAAFLFKPSLDSFTAGSALEALGTSFFSLSLGMGALITYGSYLRRDDDIVTASGAISLLDTAVAVMSCLIMFPILFSVGLVPEKGETVGLAFVSMPLAFGQMSFGWIFAVVFFALLLFAAITSAISLLEVVVSTVIDQLGWSRVKATLSVGAFIFLLGLPSAAGNLLPFWADVFGMSFFDSFDYVATKWLLPFGGLLIAVFVGWFVPSSYTREQFVTGSKLGGLYPGWLFLIRYVVPLAILLVFAYSVGIIPSEWLR